MKFGSRKYNLQPRKYDNRPRDHMDLLQPRSSCLQHHVRSTYVYINQDVLSTKVTIHWPRCTFDRGLHPLAEMYLRPRSTSIGRDVPSPEAYIHGRRCPSS